MAKDATHLTALDQPKAGRLNIQYAPDGEDVVENPPRFTWLPVIEDEFRRASQRHRGEIDQLAEKWNKEVAKIR